MYSYIYTSMHGNLTRVDKSCQTVSLPSRRITSPSRSKQGVSCQSPGPVVARFSPHHTILAHAQRHKTIRWLRSRDVFIHRLSAFYNSVDVCKKCSHCVAKQFLRWYNSLYICIYIYIYTYVCPNRAKMNFMNNAVNENWQAALSVWCVGADARSSLSEITI
jgi:hypothetical protein